MRVLLAVACLLLAATSAHAGWRYAEWGSPELNELYDLEKDPREYVNLARDGDYREQAIKMRGILQSTQERASKYK